MFSGHEIDFDIELTSLWLNGIFFMAPFNTAKKIQYENNFI